MKKGLQILGVLSLFIFSFFYTGRVVNVVKNKDPIMVKINEFEDIYNLDYVNAVINDNQIIPGINGCVTDKNKSYSAMKRIGDYNPNMIEYKEIKPELSLEQIYDKYIIKGNKNNNEVAFIFKVNNNANFESILEILSRYQVQAAFFFDGKFIEENINEIYKVMEHQHEVYNLGYNFKYDKDLLIWTNNIIETISNNRSKYCLVLEDKPDVLELCAQNNMHTIKATLLINYSNTLSAIRNSIEKGSIIVFDINNNTVRELTATINFLNSKGFKYNLLRDHLSEKGC